MTKQNRVERLHSITHPIRYEIAKILLIRDEKMFIGQIAEELGIERRLVSFHLSILSRYGLVESEWNVSPLPRSKGKAVKYYTITKVASEILDKLQSIHEL